MRVFAHRFQEFVASNASERTAQKHIARAMISIMLRRRVSFGVKGVSRPLLKYGALEGEIHTQPHNASGGNIDAMWELSTPLYLLIASCKDWYSTLGDSRWSYSGRTATSTDTSDFWRNRHNF